MHGCRLDDDALFNAFAAAVFDAVERVSGTGEASGVGRAKYQIAVTLCERCKQGWQHGDGVAAPMTEAGIAVATCDAQHLGSLDGLRPERAHQDVTPSVRRFVWHRDGGRCAVPGCRSTRNLDIHHLIARILGGSHEPDNLTLLCEAHHMQLHEGLITITGKAPRGLVITRRHDPSARPRHTKLDAITAIVAARGELVKRGYSKHDAAAAIAAVRRRAGDHASVEALVQLALEREPDSGTRVRIRDSTHPTS